MNKILLNENLAKKWLNNLLVFLAPLLVVYLGNIAIVLQQTGHIITFRDFMPNNTATGAIALYVVNGLLDYIRKLKG